MTTHTKRSSVLTTSGVAILLAGLLAGCSGGGGDIDAFCEDAKEMEDMAFLDDLDPSDPDALEAGLDELQQKVDDIEPPSDIEDAWKTTEEGFTQLVDAMRGVDMESEEDLEKVTQALEGLDSDEIQAASDEIDEFTSENCEA